jgi:hypothetical protein
MEKKILEMLELQDKLNTQTSWENWKDWITNKWKIISWRRCIYMELAEAIDSVPWKHWKNIEWKTDINNFKIELVDIWHFLLSEAIRLVWINEAKNIILANINEKYSLKLPVFWNKQENEMLNDYLKPYEDLFRISLEKEENLEYVDKLSRQFFICLDTSWMTFWELYSLYIWKNVLNKFRQNNWYKEWTYIKIWDWKEDNVIMQEILDKNNWIWFNELYEELNKIYKNLNK